jgi:hypothetical protein
VQSRERQSGARPAPPQPPLAVLPSARRPVPTARPASASRSATVGSCPGPYLVHPV